MKIIKLLMETAVALFFKIYFATTGTPKIDPTLAKTINLYKGDGFGELFALIRVWDAPYEPLDKAIGKTSRVLDLGSGDGLLGNYLAISQPGRKVFGIELNSKRAKVANKGVKNASFSKGDILKTKLASNFDAIILAHVLHHLPSKSDQIKLLTKVASKLKKASDLLILEIDYKPWPKYVFSWLTDAITVPILFEGKIFTSQFFYRRTDEWKNILQDLGFQVKTRSIDKGKPFSHVLIYAKKK